ncbi:MAG: hypothetical protein PHC43_05180 [Candidatus Marinimicrobia bacterium]|nr:hypothetical protein [Candidatus Neomarinimicrobiota bacterium]
MNTKGKKSMMLILFALIVVSPLSGAKRIDFTEARARYSGLSIFQTNEGTGFGGYFEYSLKNADRLAAQLNFTIVSGDDYPIYNYDPYYDQIYYYENPVKRRLMFLSFYGGYKKVLFADKIANNFRPFIGCMGGAVMALDPPNIPEFGKRIKKMTTAWAPAFQFGGGIDFLYGPGTLVSLFAGYEYLRFAHKIDLPQPYYDISGIYYVSRYSGQKDFSGLVIRLSFGKKL